MASSSWVIPVISFKSTSGAMSVDFDMFDDASSTETSGTIYNTSFKTFFILLLKMLLKQITYMTFTATYEESAHSREGKSHK